MRKGACYVRGRGKVQTTEIPSQTEMRELLELAVSKRIQQYIRVLPIAKTENMKETSTEHYDAIMLELISTDILKKLQTRGWWEFSLRPTTFNQELLDDIQNLPRLVRSASVDFRGWDFPHITYETWPILKMHWIENETDWWTHIERWIFDQSGLFKIYRAFEVDWIEQSEWPNKPSWEPCTVFPVMGTVTLLSEMFEFSGRLLSSTEFIACDDVQIEISAHGINGRRLVMEDPSRHLRPNYVSSLDKYTFSKTLKRDDVVAHGRTLALNVADHIFKRFNCSLNMSVLSDLQT